MTLTQSNSEHRDDHIGRSWTGSRLEDECPCPQEPCGLISFSKVVEDCPQHSIGRFKTMRQIHKPELCPGVKEAWETSDASLIVMGTHDIDEALNMAKKYYADVEADDYDVSREDFEALAKKRWVDKSNPLYESELWSDEMVSDEHKNGWSPYILVFH